MDEQATVQGALPDAEAAQQVVDATPRVVLWSTLAVVMAVLAFWMGPGQTPSSLPSDATFELDRDLAKAKVSVRRDGADRPCTWNSGDNRFQCGPEYWAFVGPYGGMSGGKPRRCTWAHPVAPGATTTLRWPEQAIGQSLTVSLGLVDEAGPGAVVSMRVLVGTEQLAELATSDSRDADAQVLQLPGGVPKGELRIELRTPDNTLRMACVDLKMAGQRSAAEPIPEAP